MPYQRINPEPVSTALGARITGLDLSRPLDEDVFAEVHQAFLDYQVLIFPKQQLNPQHLIDFAKRLGPLARYPFVAGMQETQKVWSQNRESGA